MLAKNKPTRLFCRIIENEEHKYKNIKDNFIEHGYKAIFLHQRMPGQNKLECLPLTNILRLI